MVDKCSFLLNECGRKLPMWWKEIPYRLGVDSDDTLLTCSGKEPCGGALFEVWWKSPLNFILINFLSNSSIFLDHLNQ